MLSKIVWLHIKITNIIISSSGWQDYLSGDPENRIVTQHYPIQATPGAFFSFDSSQILRFVAIKQKNPTTFVIGLSWSGWQEAFEASSAF